MNWLHVGSSPSVIDTLPIVLATREFDSVITCNAGIKLYPFPDVCVLCDGVASVDYEPQAREAQAQGTKLVTLKRKCPKAIHDRRIHGYDEYLELPGVPKLFDGKSHTAFRFSGPLCLEYALLHGATTLVLVGCDGWTGDNDYFDSHEGHNTKNPNGNIHERSTLSILRPQFQRMAEVMPHVRFIQYGAPTYQIDSPNWEVRR